MAEKKALMLASVASMIDQFNMPNIKLLQSLGYHVDVVADFSNPGNISTERANNLTERLESLHARVIDIAIPRSLNPGSVTRAYKRVKELIANEHYNLIHCHSPIGGAIARFAARKERKTGARVIYTAHGFHFYSGASIKNWMIYYPVERWLSNYTDTLITINKEDYQRAKKGFKAGKVVYIPGIGVDTQKYREFCSGDRIRDELGIGKKDNMLLSVGELNDNKNHETVIRALARLEEKPYYVIVGKGEKREYYEKLIAELNLQDRIRLAGFREDVADFYKAADVFVFPSFREGLSVSLMEAMASGLPVICSKIRGNTDLIAEGDGGFFFDPKSIEGIADGIRKVLDADRKAMGSYNLEAIKDFDLGEVEKLITDVYLGKI